MTGGAAAPMSTGDHGPITTISAGERGEVSVFADSEALARAAAAAFAEIVSQAVDARGLALVALSGGTTPRRMGELLAAEPYRSKVPWASIEFFWGDERWVPLESDESNAGVAMRTFLDEVPVEPSRINPFPVELSDAALAADVYATRLRTVTGETDTVPVFDLVLLGMGDDGHTASLFPGTKAVHETEALVVAHHVAKLDATRLTFSPPLLNAGREIVFLVGGAAKAGVLRDVLFGPDRVDDLPSQLIRPTGGRLRWLVDAAAAAQLGDATGG